jgi:hypothetical protein
MVHTVSKLWLLGACAALASACDQAAGPPSSADPDMAVLPGTESSRDFGDYVVHFNALATDQLTPDIAREYGIVRSQNRALLNVSILRKQAGTVGSAVAGSVSASANNLTGQLKTIPVREIREGDAIYYIGEVAIANAETLIFTVDVTPLNEPSRFTVRFQKQFFVD